MRRAVVGFVLACSLHSCGPWQRVGAPDRPQPGVEVARLFDAATIYDRMGFFVTGAPLPMVATLRYLAGPTPDSTLALFALSLASNSLSFRRDANEFVAEYRVEVVLRSDSAASVQLASDQMVRVRSFQETLRADESIVFQGFLMAPPGAYSASVMIRDRNSPAFARRERADTVPRFAGPSLSSPIPFYEGVGRGSLGDRPDLLANPRATLPYGADTLRFYVEGYGLAMGTRLAVEASDLSDNVLWRDTVALEHAAGLARTTVRLAAAQLPVGEEELRLETVGGAARTRTRLLVSFSSQWVITNYTEMVSLLRYFEQQNQVAKLRNAPPEQRAEVWREFWKATDPVPVTPENEALDAYLLRVQTANLRFQETGRPGWLTDRGEVSITLGDPDEVFDFSGSAASRGGVQGIRWTYNSLRLTLLFQDLTGFGRFELTPSSRADYLQVLARVRRAQ
ncbi:MAG: GWxTD domain-containing protein [Gemmatimonadales bacterium]